MIVFQYNPETLTRFFPPPVLGPAPPAPGSEVISFTLSLDAIDLDRPIEPAGLLRTLSALEELVAQSPGAAPMDVLFVWGPHRILAGRLASLLVRETSFNAELAPVRAEVDIVLNVLQRHGEDAPQPIRNADAANVAARKKFLETLPHQLPDYVARILK